MSRGELHFDGGSKEQAMAEKEYKSKRLESTEELEKYFGFLFGRAYTKLRDAEALYNGLNAALLAGTITGLQLLTLDKHLSEDIRKAENRIRMLNLSKIAAERQLRKEGACYV